MKTHPSHTLCGTHTLRREPRLPYKAIFHQAVCPGHWEVWRSGRTPSRTPGPAQKRKRTGKRERAAPVCFNLEQRSKALIGSTGADAATLPMFTTRSILVQEKPALRMLLLGLLKIWKIHSSFKWKQCFSFLKPHVANQENNEFQIGKLKMFRWFHLISYWYHEFIPLPAFN